MRRSAIVLAAHGSRVDPSVNETLRHLAVQIKQLSRIDEVEAAFHHGEPVFARVLDGLRAEDITVVPVMAAEGYYARRVLPREMARNRRFPWIRVRQTPAVGSHSLIVSLVARRVAKRLREHGFRSSDTALAIVGHGTRRHRRSRTSTCCLASALRESAVCKEVVAAFLDEDPAVETIAGQTSTPHILVEPFLIGSGPHSTRDLPRRLGFNHAKVTMPPIADHIAGRTVVVDSPIGMDPGIIDIIVDLAGERGGASADKRR